jgi:hypothetical protein
MKDCLLLVSAGLMATALGCAAPVTSRADAGDASREDAPALDGAEAVIDAAEGGEVAEDANANARPNYHEDIAPLLAQRCVSCHSAGEIGPFALNTYADARARHAAIASAVPARTMPPWLPATSCQSFRDTRALTDEEIQRVERWSASGAPEGPARTPPERAAAVTLPWVDTEVDLGGEFVPRGVDGPLDQWWCFALDPGLTEEKVLIGYELVPTARSQVHHAGFVEAPLADARAIDASEPGLGWRCSGSVGVGSGRVLGSWAGGFGATLYPAQTGIRLRPGNALVLQIHYHLPSSGPPTPDRTRLRLQYARSPVAHEAEYWPMAVPGVSVPPRSVGHVQRATYTVASDTVLRAVQPHMHVIGRRVSVSLIEGERRTCLLDVPRWDHHWEEMFFYNPSAPLIARAGSTIEIGCTWDNATDAPVNEGLTVLDEMCDVSFITTRP